MRKMEVARQVADKLYHTEEAIDSAVAQASEFMVELIGARRELRLSATVGTDVPAKVSEAIAALAEARRAVAEAHSALNDVQGQIGIRGVMAGPLDKPTTPMIARRELRLASGE